MIIPHDPMGNTLKAMDLITERHKALASNVANMNTPNYRRKDVSFSQYLGAYSDPLETNLAHKMGPSPISVDESSTERIDVARELSEMQKNSVLFTIATRRMTSLITQMRTVINMGNS